MDENEITQTNLLDFEAGEGVPMMPDSFKGTCRTNGGYTKPAPRAGLCSEDRSMISPDYARNFICDFILGKEQIGTQLSMF